MGSTLGRRFLVVSRRPFADIPGRRSRERRGLLFHDPPHSVPDRDAVADVDFVVADSHLLDASSITQNDLDDWQGLLTASASRSSLTSRSRSDGSPIRQSQLLRLRQRLRAAPKGLDVTVRIFDFPDAAITRSKLDRHAVLGHGVAVPRRPKRKTSYERRARQPAVCSNAGPVSNTQESRRGPRGVGHAREPGARASCELGASALLSGERSLGRHSVRSAARDGFAERQLSPSLRLGRIGVTSLGTSASRRAHRFPRLDRCVADACHLRRAVAPLGSAPAA